MSQKLELMERNHAHIEAIQTHILQTQSIILSRLEKVERALLPQKHSTLNRFRVTDLASTRSRWEWQEDDYYMEWNRSDSIQPLPSPVRPLADGHQIPVVSTNQAPHYGIDHSMPYHRHLAHGTEPTLSYHRGLGHGTEPTLPNRHGLGLGTELSTHTHQGFRDRVRVVAQLRREPLGESGLDAHRGTSVTLRRMNGASIRPAPLRSTRRLVPAGPPAKTGGW